MAANLDEQLAALDPVDIYEDNTQQSELSEEELLRQILGAEAQTTESNSEMELDLTGLE